MKRAAQPVRRGPALRLTLTGAFVGLTAGTLLIVGLLLLGFLAASRGAILDTADALRRAASERVEAAVVRNLGVAQEAAQGVAAQVRLHVVDPDDPVAVEKTLFATSIGEPTLSDLSFTRASASGYDDRGDVIVAPGAWEIAVYRNAAGGTGGIGTRITRHRGDRWTAQVRVRAADEPLAGGTLRSEEHAEDPTGRMTFIAATARDQQGELLWSDLHWSDLDSGPDRRVVMTVQQAVADGRGALIGVVRVGLLTDAIDQAVHVRVEEADADDPHLVFLCDAQGRLLSRVAAKDRLELSGDDLRFAPTDPPPQLSAALRLPMLSRLAAGQEATAGDLVVAGHKYLATFRRLAETQDWIVGIVVPEEHYTARLQAIRRRFLALYLVVAIFALAAGLLTTRAVRRGLGRVRESTTRMLAFDFRPAAPVATFPDVEAVLDGLERAKTAMRALGKYTPLDLVKQLVGSNVEPRLGGRLSEVTVMFSDIQGFTDLAERVTPDELAELLGAYLEAMTEAIRATGGIIDKFIGDAVMALWNAPGAVADHPRQACRAVLACMSATRALYESPGWRGLPPLVTRFGVHTDRVLVGHFGARERMSYTALGDGVNLASRLEALGKQYGVTALVSDAVAQHLADGFALRRLDKVAVKGKSRAVVVYELLESAAARTGAVIAYEDALEDYFARRFDQAVARLEAHSDTDPPSAVLLARCRRLRESPPPPEWDGVFVATSK